MYPTLIDLQLCWHSLVLGLVVGLTEFLPISSSAHLKVVPILLGWGDPGVALSAVVELGSTAAVIGFFRTELTGISRAMGRSMRHGDWKNPESQLGLAILVGTLPVLIAGSLLKRLLPDFEHSALRSLTAIGIVSIGMALLLALAEIVGRRFKKLNQVGVGDGWLIGAAQALAIIPGVSRSGSTITASLMVGWQRESAAEFSFLLGIPAIGLTGLVELPDALKQVSITGVIPLLVGVVTAGVVSWFTIGLLLTYLRRNSTWVFVIYRLVFGLVLLSGRVS